MRRSLGITALLLALAMPAAARADDASLLRAYTSKATALKAQDKQIVRLTKRWQSHRAKFGPRIVKVLKRQQATLFTVAGAVQRETESSPNGAQAKKLCLASLKAMGQGDSAAIRAFVADRHHHAAKAVRSFKAAVKLQRKGRKLDKRAAAAFHAAGVL
ncbi:MAG: hypothetical protein QOF37_473 [Thermoleophilaceae bacterium]|jgi:hypothetical protein|nr:hypothetical protein [Thermoleophilaceae bacterium]